MSDLYIPRIGPHNFLAAEYEDRSWKYRNLSQTDECRNWETEHYNSVLEITVSFLEIYKWEPDIHIGFSPALHLQCGDTAIIDDILLFLHGKTGKRHQTGKSAQK